MKKITKTLAAVTLSTLYFLHLCSAQSIAPEVYSTSGGHYTGANAQLSWTIGEPVIETVSNTNNIITQGFHQTSYDITSIEENLDLGYEILVFPNPVSNILQINISGDVENSNLKIELIDVTGRTLINKNISGTTGNHQLNLNEHAPGSYFLKITTKKGELINSFKIQKIN